MNYKKLLYKYSLIFLGFLLFISYIWFRFIRTRVPREIPLKLMVITFLLILISALIYLYVIIRLFKPAQKHSMFKEVTNMMFRPLEEFDAFLKQYISLNAFILYTYHSIKDPYFLYLLTNILPRIITATALIVDAFFCHKFNYIYKILFISLIPLLARYFIYSLKKIKEQQIIAYAPKIRLIDTPYVVGVMPKIDQDEEDDEDDNVLMEYMSLPLDIFVDYQTKRICLDGKGAEYNVYRPKEIYDGYKIKFNIPELTSEHLEQIRNEAKETIENIISLSVFVFKYQHSYILKKAIRNLKALTYLLYLICWGYILFICFPQVKWMTGLVSLIHTLKIIEDPFSGQSIYLDLVMYIIENKDIFIVEIVYKRGK